MTRKQFTRILAVVIVILFFAITFFILNNKSKQAEQVLQIDTKKPVEEPVAKLNKPEAEANVSLGKFKRNYTKDDQVIWELEGQTANIYNQDNFLEIIDPRLISYQNREDPVKISSSEALVKFAEKDIEQVDLNKNVKIQNTKYTITTEEARFNQKSNQVYSSKLVKIINLKNEISGIIFTGNLSSEQFRFDSSVESTFLEEESKKKKKQKINVKSDQLFIDNQKGNFIYENNVDALQGKNKILADKLSGKFNEEQDVESMLASGNVKINNPTDKMTATANQAKFLLDQNLIILTGNAVLTKEKNQLIADKIIYNTVTKKSEASGEAEVKILDF